MSEQDALARGAARLAMQMIATAPPAIQVEAAVMVLKAVFMSNVKPAAQLKLFDQYVGRARADIEANLKGAKNVKTKSRN